MAKNRLPIFSKVVAANSVKVATGVLNNVTASLQFAVNNSGKKSAQVGDYVALWDKDTYATPDLDANARIGIVTARTNKTLTIRWGEFDTPIVAYTGRPSLAVALNAVNSLDSLIEQVSDVSSQVEVARTADFTLALADSGKLNIINADGKVATLPTSAPGITLAFEIGTTDTANGVGEIGFAISPAAADAIDGGGTGAGVTNKDVLVTKGTARKGDRIVVVGGATNKWVISHLAATITREP